ncbi:hypothetical protein ACFLQN_01385 [Candidatus Aenigmatarchaeota archaeon]
MYKKEFLIIIIIIFSFISLFYIIPFHSTGLATAPIGVSVEGIMKGEITSLIYDPYITIGARENISTEFTNVGSELFTAKIYIYIFKFNNNSLLQLAEYADSSVQLYPGMMRHYSSTFIPNETGLYYIQVKVPYDTKNAETWAVFVVSDGEQNQTQGNGTGEGGAGGGAGTTTVTPSFSILEAEPDMKLTYESTVQIIRGESYLYRIDIDNTGNVDLFGLRPFISTTNKLNTEITPKIIQRVKKGKSTSFLISIDPDNDIELGSYTLFFSIITDRLKKDGRAEIEIIDEPFSLRDYLYNIILNYKLLILQIKNEIADAKMDGYDISVAEYYIEQADLDLNSAKNLFEQEKYDETKDKLYDTKENIKEAVFALANSMIIIFEAEAFPTFYVLLIIIIVIAIFLILFFWRKKKKKKKNLKPKLLRGKSEE